MSLMPHNNAETMMNKILVGAATAALWLGVSYAAHAERVCKQVCDGGTCVSKCVEHPDAGVVVHEHDYDRGPGVGVHVPGVGVEIGR
jgi:hypothetical protein